MYKERTATVTERLNQAMRLKGIRQTDLCKLCNIPKGAMSLYVSGAYEPKQERLEALAIALGVDIAWLMGYDVGMSPSNNNIENAPEEPKLTEGEEMWLELYHLLTDESKAILYNTIPTLRSLPKEKQATAAQSFLQLLSSLQ